MGIMGEVREQLAARLAVMLPHLDERQRRLLLGAEARVLGHGGIAAVARAAGVREATVAAGVDALDAGVAPLGRVRRVGGGRKRVSQTDPGLVPALLALVEPDERGDPMSPLRWTTKSLRRLAAELTGQGHRVSADTVGRILHEQGFSLQGNAKVLEGRRHPDRDGQFRYLNEQVKDHQGVGDAVISIDCKKKELLGEYANGGAEWAPAGQPVAVRSHDFPDPDTARAIPYGIYDLTGNVGWVNVGVDHETAAFAVESIRRWWYSVGAAAYPGAGRLLITADAGGSNRANGRVFKAELADLAVQTGLAITVCHLPPGTSKWNKIEHRLFCHITHNWRGRPLTSHDVVVNSIAATTTTTGLIVHADLDTGTYPIGVSIPDHHLHALPLTRHTWHGDWNYTLHPTAYTIVKPPRRRPSTPPATGQPNTNPSSDIIPDHDIAPDHIAPEYAWLAHPAITGLSTTDWHTLTTDYITLHQQRHPPNPTQTQPRHTPAERLLAAALHERHQLPQREIAALFHTHHNTMNRICCRTLELLDDTGHTIPTAPHKLTTLQDLHHLATQNGIKPPPQQDQPAS